MTDPIRALTAALPAAGEAQSTARPAGGVDFADALVDAIGDASQAERHAQELAVRFARGDPDVGVHETMIAAGKASVAVRFAVTLKNRVVEAYRDLMRTQV